MGFFKSILVFLGGILVGFGIGLIAPKNLVFSETNSWLAGISSLILGGFLMALGLVVGGRKKPFDATQGKEKPKPPLPPTPPSPHSTPEPPKEQLPPNV
ncbi:MAG: hypothetical protein ABH813_02255 [Patescibacteria group bacterium]